MFCPECGIEDRQSNQFCRSCGTDMRRVRTAFAVPDSVTASAISAREDIGRAIAAKIKEYRTPGELSELAEDVLPEIEKFLESPDEKRLRRMRTGTIVAAVGLGTAVGLILASLAMNKQDLVFLAGLGVITFFIGLAFILNGIFLTVPKKAARGDVKRSEEPTVALSGTFARTNELEPPPASTLFGSVTEGTTRHLDDQKSRSR